MHSLSFGSRKKPCLVILHGWGLSSEPFAELGKLLSSDFYVIIPDLPGFGQTPEPKQPYDVSDYAKALKKFLKKEGISEAYFIGHSFGGRILLKLAHLDTQLVKALVLTGSPGVEAFKLKRTLRRMVLWGMGKFTKVFGFLPPVKRLKQRFYASRDFGKVEGVMKKTFLKVIRQRLSHDAKNLTQPALLLWGSRDTLVPVHDAQKLLETIPQAYLKVFANVGHKLPYAKPHEFAREAKQFFQRLQHGK